MFDCRFRWPMKTWDFTSGQIVDLNGKMTWFHHPKVRKKWIGLRENQQANHDLTAKHTGFFLTKKGRFFFAKKIAPPGFSNHPWDQPCVGNQIHMDKHPLAIQHYSTWVIIQPWGISSIIAIQRWCPIAPKWDILPIPVIQLCTSHPSISTGFHLHQKTSCARYATGSPVHGKHHLSLPCGIIQVWWPEPSTNCAT